MKRTTYDQHDASRLVPLLKSITDEMIERTQRCQVLEQLIATLGNRTREPSAVERKIELEAELSVHRREMRQSERELARLGCTLDGDHPLRVLIPGTDGDHGYSWSPVDGSLEASAR
jgi:hypothetical protein